jgi:hypothetical protein
LFIQQILSIVKGNDKPAVLDALISSNNVVWPKFNMHPLETSMRLAQAAHAQSHGSPISQEDEEQLQYANLLIDVSHSRNSDACHVLQAIDEDVFTIGFLFVQYFTQYDHEKALEWLYSGGQLDYSATTLCTTNTIVDALNEIAQGLNTSEEHILTSNDNFSEVDDINNHPKKMLSTTILNSFCKNGVPNHKLKLKFGDVYLVVHTIHGLGVANNVKS